MRFEQSCDPWSSRELPGCFLNKRINERKQIIRARITIENASRFYGGTARCGSREISKIVWQSNIDQANDMIEGFAFLMKLSHLKRICEPLYELFSCIQRDAFRARNCSLYEISRMLIRSWNNIEDRQKSGKRFLSVTVVGSVYM